MSAIIGTCGKRSCYWYESGKCGLAKIDLTGMYQCLQDQRIGIVPSKYQHWKRCAA